MAKISPFLWFEGNMQEAVNSYMSVFKDARVVAMSPAMATFELLGQRFHALNAHPPDKFNDAVSFFIDCDTQEEVDYYWDQLSAGGGHRQCGWLKDRFGLSWQVIPKALGRFLMDEDREKANRVMQAMLRMKKIVIADLEAAYKG